MKFQTETTMRSKIEVDVDVINYCAIEFLEALGNKEPTEEQISAIEHILQHSSKDTRIVTYHACKLLNVPKSRIVLKRFSEKLNQMVFNIQHDNKDQIEEKTAKEISLDKMLVKNLAPEEAHMIGYITANEQERLTEKLKKELKNKYTAIQENKLSFEY